MRLAFVVAAFLLAGCASGSGVREAEDPNVVEGDDIERRGIERIEAMLRGQIAGVQVEQKGNDLVIRIRGGEGFGYSTGDPLFVIDGFPIAFGADGALRGLNPHDVASIRVLKNVSETALYGARGANGVVLITTLRPPGSGDS